VTDAPIYPTFSTRATRLRRHWSVLISTSTKGNRLVRSSVEREFIIIGECISALSRVAPDVFAAITRARRIVDFRNQLTHEYPTVDDALVWAIADRDVHVLRDEYAAVMKSIETEGDGD